jgi:hypothetical protein
MPQSHAKSYDEELSPEFRTVLTLDRVHSWALTGTVAVQLLLVGSVWGHTPVMAELMAGYLAAALVGLCAWSVIERGVSPDSAAALGAAGALGYLLVAGRWTQYAPPFWMGVAVLGLIAAGSHHAWSRLRVGAILGAVAAVATLETHHPAEIFAWTAGAAVPYLVLEIGLALQRRAHAFEDAAGAPDLVPQRN